MIARGGSLACVEDINAHVAGVSAELHQGAAQSLVVALMSLDYLIEDPEPITREKLVGVRGHVSDALQHIRLVIDGQESHRSKQTLEELLIGIAERFNRISPKVDVSFQSQDNVEPSMQVAATLAHIASEATCNAVKHGNANEVKVRTKVRGDGKHLVLTVRDNGSGMPESIRSEGMGIKLMQMWASSVDAKLVVIARPTIGTLIRCVLPQWGVESGKVSK